MMKSKFTSRPYFTFIIFDKYLHKTLLKLRNNFVFFSAFQQVACKDDKVTKIP